MTFNIYTIYNPQAFNPFERGFFKFIFYFFPDVKTWKKNILQKNPM